MRTSVVVAASLLLLSSCGFLPGMRLFQVEYHVDSRLVLAAAYDESDAVPIEDLWGSLAEAPIHVTNDSPVVTPDPANPLKAVLSGEIEVHLVHAGARLSTAKLDQLSLVRESDTSDLWHPDATTVKKLSGAATY